MAVHNRLDVTRACLQSLAAQTVDADITAFVFDDGSTDGTGAMLSEEFPEARVVTGDGSFFWNGGMRVAMAAAMAEDPDHYLWLNDDTTMVPDAVETLLQTVKSVDGGPDVPLAVVGAVVDPDDGQLAYSGVNRGGWQPMRFEKLQPVDRPVRVDTMNGNCALLTRAAVALVGNLDSTYTHGMGDYHYGFELTRLGGTVWLAPGVLGECHANPGFVPKGDSVRKDLARLRSVKFLPPAEWGHFVRAWGGPAWPVLWASPYVTTAARLVRDRMRGQD